MSRSLSTSKIPPVTLPKPKFFLVQNEEDSETDTSSDEESMDESPVVIDETPVIINEAPVVLNSKIVNLTTPQCMASKTNTPPPPPPKPKNFSLKQLPKAPLPPPRPKHLTLKYLARLDSIDSNVSSSDCDSPVVTEVSKIYNFDKETREALPVVLLNKISTMYDKVLTRPPIEQTVKELEVMSRNAQELGRDRQFAQRFTNILGNFNAIECASSQFGANDVQIDTPDGLARSQNPEAFTAADKMARLVEILFYVTKNRKNKLHLVDQGIVEVVKNIFESHFNRRFVDSVHSEIALISTAVIRHLSKTKKGKEELTRLNVLQMCEECIQKLSDDRVQLASRKNLLANCTQLQDSLCALAIRCLPQLTFPITSQKFPLAFPVPQEGQNVLKSEAKNECQNEDGMDSDDEDGIDEEEDSFLNFMKDPKPPTNENSNGADDEMIAFQSDDEDSNQKMEVSDEKLPKFSKQKLAGLKANYSKIFLELEQGASASNVPSPKLRRTNEGAVPSVPEAQSQEKKPDYKESIIRLAEETKSVANFIKIAYPELVNPDIETNRNDLLANQDSMRETVMQKLTKLRQQSNEANKPNVVFDLDELHSKPTAKMPLSNNDAEKVGKLDPSTKNLKFESRFESGNLRQAIQVSENHYELVLSPDINEMRSHYQWFYFEVSNNQANVPYTFEVINCLKNTSMFSKGMQPVMFSVAEAQQGRPGWVRCGQAVCYYRNLYVPPTNGSSSSGSETEKTTTRRRTLSENNKKGKECDKENKSYFSIRFSIRFRHAADVCYIAYHFPYTYSYLQATLERHLSEVNSNSIYVRSDRLTTTLAGNPVNILTITAPAEPEVLKQRKFVVFTSRVHPGESNASWTMHGILKKLMAPEAQVLREKFVFKIVPMLNPDGVINGSHRCSLAGVDLNRCWDNPTEHKHPTIYHAKGVLQYMVDVLKKTPLCFVDLHGHSRKSNVFCYGNNPEESWRKADRLMPQHQFQTLPELLDKHADGFSLKDCRYSITKAKESSARIALWRQFGLDRCYTMESTYCGFDQGPLQSKQIGIQDLKKMGQHLCEVLVELEDVVKRNSLPVGQKGKEMRTPLAVNKVAPQLSTPNSSTSLDQDPVRGFRSKRTSISNGTISQNSSKKSLAKQWKSTQQ
ncbi:unnamed protein product [Bursaphelenchus okinawaensis]|uniref:Peptidase M14 domain-containing protein n=1 Tax=Bursaphelenchus okinawaensis TaxID=465554 RepID=A0A811JRE1_9BILA|nr:unnamed protein product [Bursaphelenchus okinawaensis]CAG9079581.1 unnamed protein product [Bursaphelenchus okinawaensis]